jgi:hypothetical protein
MIEGDERKRTAGFDAACVNGDAIGELLDRTEV